MAAHTRSEHAFDHLRMAAVTRIDDLRTLLRKYGQLRGILSRVGNRPLMLKTKLRVTLVGKFAPSTMRGYLGLVYLYPPDLVDVALRKSSVGSRNYLPRPSVTCEWQGQRAVKLLDAVGWTVDKPSFDTKALALRRWLAYRKASGTYWRDRA